MCAFTFLVAPDEPGLCGPVRVPLPVVLAFVVQEVHPLRDLLPPEPLTALHLDAATSHAPPLWVQLPPPVPRRGPGETASPLLPRPPEVRY